LSVINKIKIIPNFGGIMFPMERIFVKITFFGC